MKQVRLYAGMTSEQYLLRHPESFICTRICDQMADYSRTRYNRMNGVEQEKYMKRLSEKKPFYYLYASQTSMYRLTKTEYQYLSQKYPDRVRVKELEV